MADGPQALAALMQRQQQERLQQEQQNMMRIVSSSACVCACLCGTSCSSVPFATVWSVGIMQVLLCALHSYPRQFSVFVGSERTQCQPVQHCAFAAPLHSRFLCILCACATSLHVLPLCLGLFFVSHFLVLSSPAFLLLSSCLKGLRAAPSIPIRSACACFVSTSAFSEFACLRCLCCLYFLCVWILCMRRFPHSSSPAFPRGLLSSERPQC